MLCIENELGDSEVVGDVREWRVAAVYLSHGRRRCPRADGSELVRVELEFGKGRGMVCAPPLSLGCLYTGRFPGASP